MHICEQVILVICREAILKMAYGLPALVKTSAPIEHGSITSLPFKEILTDANQPTDGHEGSIGKLFIQ